MAAAAAESRECAVVVKKIRSLDLPRERNLEHEVKALCEVEVRGGTSLSTGQGP